MRIELKHLPDGLFTWTRYDDDGAVIFGGTGRWQYEADCYDDLVAENSDYLTVGVRFLDNAAKFEGSGEHVKPPVAGHPIGPGRWSTVDPQALPDA